MARVVQTPIPAKRKPAATVALRERIRELEARLQESEEILAALRSGELDAVMVAQGGADYRLHTLVSADEPYRVFIEQIQEGAVTLRQDGTMLYGNRRLAAMLGLPLERLAAGQALQSFVLAEDVAVLSRLFAQAVHGAARGEITLCSEGGRQIPAQISLGYLRRDGDQTVLCGMLTDLTEQHGHHREMADKNARLEAEIAGRKQVEAALRHAQKLEAIGGLAAGVAHDFNNILQSIVGCLELVQDDYAEGAPGRRFVDIALNAAVRGSSLTHHLLSYARRQMLQPRTVALARFLAELQEVLTRTLGPNVIVEVRTRQMPAIAVDPGQLQTALLNLAINAAHAMPRGGSLLIDARPFAGDGVPLVSIAVTDTGTGMDAATLGCAADPFFTTKGLDGTGLGLSMVHGFAEQSGGRMRIRSTPGQGTTVELLLPAATVEVPPQAGERPVSQAPDSATVLLVDDEADVLATTAAVLEMAGFTVIRAGHAAEALTRLDDHPGIDILVTDFAMPGMNGGELLAAARRRHPMPGIIITGYADAMEAAIVGGDVVILLKPFARCDLIGAIRNKLQQTDVGQATDDTPDAG